MPKHLRVTRAARILRIVGWTALILGALFVAVALYFTRVYGGASSLRELFTLAHLPDLLGLLSALLPGILLLLAARKA